MLPPDGHVHSEWSWDATKGSMEATCARAVELGLPGIAFTEHADFCPLDLLPEALDEYPHLRAFADDVATLRPPPLDVDGYFAELERCRSLFPQLRILSGVELGDPHRDPDGVARLLASAPFERVIGSLHSLPHRGRYAEPPVLFRDLEPVDVMRGYLVELVRLVEAIDAFDVLGHVGYAARSWPADGAAFDVRLFEGELRDVLRALAAGGRALEVNSEDPLPPDVVRWWHEEGGERVVHGSDAHEPARLARGFRSARDPRR